MMAQELDIFPEPVDTSNAHEMRVGQVGTVKGKIGYIMGDAFEVNFPDWTTMVIEHSGATDTLIRIRDTQKYAAIKVRCVDEDATLVALAIWTLPGGVPVPLTTVPEEI